MTAIAVLGTGRMGAAIARRLLATGHEVTIWNRTLARTDELRVAGARVADSPAAAADRAELVITMLTDGAALDAVLFGRCGAASGLRPGGCLVQMSTIGPADVRDLARRLPSGVALVDAPVAGSVGAALAGRLTVLAGGDADVLQRIDPVLTALGPVRRCGGVGAGSAVKLVLNTALVTALAALVDTLAVASAVGVGRDAALDALRAGPLGGAVRRATATDASFAAELASKDLELALAELADTPAPVAHAAAQVLAAAPDRAADIASLVFKE